ALRDRTSEERSKVRGQRSDVIATAVQQVTTNRGPLTTDVFYFRTTTREPTDRISDNSSASCGETRRLGGLAANPAGVEPLLMMSVGAPAAAVVAALRRMIVRSAAIGVVAYALGFAVLEGPDSF